MELCCKRCGSAKQVKNGLMRGKQRYLCKACGLTFTDTPPRGKPLALKAAAVLLYVSGLSMNRTAKLLASPHPPSRPGWSRSRPPPPRSPSLKVGRW
jgi:transposase-like protein